MAAPTLVQAGAGATDATGAWSTSYTPNNLNGNVLIFHVLQDGTTSGAVTISGFSADAPIVNLAGQWPNWNYLGEFPGDGCINHLWIARTTTGHGTSITVNGGNSTSEDLYFRWYEFTNVSAATALAQVIENGTLTTLISQDTGTSTNQFGTDAQQLLAESFTAVGPHISQVTVYLCVSGNPSDDVVLEIRADNAGVPSETVLASASRSMIGLPMYPDASAQVFTVDCNVITDTTYWIVLSRTGALVSSTPCPNAYRAPSNVYSGGARAYYDATGWHVDSGTDLRFIVEGYPFVLNGVGTQASVLDTAVTTLGPDRLALNFVGINDDNAISAFSGETGGDWLEAVAEYAESSGTDASIGLQVAVPGGLYQPQANADRQMGGNTGNEKMAQSFVAQGNVTQIRTCVAKANSPTDNLVIEIQSDSSGSPSGTVLGSVSITGSALPTSTTWREDDLSATLDAGSTYWVVFRRSGSLDAVNYYVLGYTASEVWADGARKEYVNGVWTSVTGDFGLGVSNRNLLGGTIDGGSFTQADGTDGWGVVGFALIGNTQLYEQSHYRFRNDDGNESTATWKAALDTATTYALNDKFRVRFALLEKNLGASVDSSPTLYYRKNGGSWTIIGDASGDVPIRAVASPNVTDETSTTQQISTETFGASGSGKFEEVSNYTLASALLDAGKVCEYEWSLQVYSGASSPFVANDVVELLLYPYNVAERVVPTKLATFTVVSGTTPGPVPLKRREAHRFLTMR